MPTPPIRAVFCVVGPLDSYSRHVEPGNTGPYLFRVGLDNALQMQYGRSDLTLKRDCAKASVAVSVNRGSVRLLDPQ